jgi:hypothetical protein
LLKFWQFLNQAKSVENLDSASTPFEYTPAARPVDVLQQFVGVFENRLVDRTVKSGAVTEDTILQRQRFHHLPHKR